MTVDETVCKGFCGRSLEQQEQEVTWVCKSLFSTMWQYSWRNVNYDAFLEEMGGGCCCQEAFFFFKY